MGCIYMYTNKINGKRYVGQTICHLQKRHQQHLCQHETYFDRALAKYGEENFSLEVLQDDISEVEELNRLEEFYIQKYDTFNNGYNMDRGGNNRTRFSKKDRDTILDLLKNSNLSMMQIGEKTGYSVYTISDINTGETFPKDGISYPIRKRRCSERYEEEDYWAVANLLKDTDLSFEEIAVKTGTDLNLVFDINRGKRIEWFKKTGLSVPIRKTVQKAKISVSLGKQIIEALKKQDMSTNEIGQLFNVPGYTVGSINRGTHSVCREIKEDYPVRKKLYRNPSNKIFSSSQLNQIVDFLLNTSLSLEEIAQRMGVSKSTIKSINAGGNYHNNLAVYKFPLRQNKDYNFSIFSSVKE